MADPPYDLVAQLEARLSELESRYTLLARTVEELDEVVVDQAKTIELLERKSMLLTGQLAALAEQPPEARDLEDDKPPHY